MVERYITKIINNQIGFGRLQQFARAGGGQRNDFATGAFACRNACCGILENDTLFRSQTKSFGTAQIDIRCGFADLDIILATPRRNVWLDVANIDGKFDIFTTRRRTDTALYIVFGCCRKQPGKSRNRFILLAKNLSIDTLLLLRQLAPSLLGDNLRHQQLEYRFVASAKHIGRKWSFDAILRQKNRKGANVLLCVVQNDTVHIEYQST